MSSKNHRIKEKSTFDVLSEFIHKYAYAETIVVVSLFLLIGYYVDPNDICLLNADIPYVILILTLITLFHGFESGILALTIISIVMWYFYPTFNYIVFLTFLLMTLLLSQFHFYWMVRLKKAEVDASYKSSKLAELSRAFYSLKISHDQLEKNYVVKPMSIRNAVNHILRLNEELAHDDTIKEKQKAFNRNLLELLEKSFNLTIGYVIYLEHEPVNDFKKGELGLVSIGTEDPKKAHEVIEDYIVDKSIARKAPVYISDESGEPTTTHSHNGKYLASIPALINDKIVSLLVIEKMPFMFFNREYLTSMTIIHEYFTLETHKTVQLVDFTEVELIDDKEFKFEIYRMKKLYEQFKVNSVLLVLRTESELRAIRLMDKLDRMLRSLDMLHLVKYKERYFITMLLPMNDKSSAIGLLNRLRNTLEDEKDKKFDHMIFNMRQLHLLNKYYRSDYED